MANFPDLPLEILLQILAYFVTPVPLSLQPFWCLDIMPHTLLLPDGTMKEHKEQNEEQIRMARGLHLVCRRMREGLMPFLRSRFDCSNAVGLRRLIDACAGERNYGQYIRHLDLQLSSMNASPRLSPQLASLYSLTLTLSHRNPGQQWLAEKLQDVRTLRSLNLRIYGSSLGPHFRALPQLKALSIEMRPPREVDYDRTELFNDVVEMVDACVKDGNVESLGLFVHQTMVNTFYKHIEKSPSLPNPSALVRRGPSIPQDLSIKQLAPSSLGNLSRLSLNLESTAGTTAFLRATSGLPITDLALISRDLILFSGAVFKDFCLTFGRLRKLRLKLRDAGNWMSKVEEGSANPDAFVKGLVSLKYLEAFKGPILFRRRNEQEVLQRVAREWLDEVVLALRKSQTLSADLLMQWHPCLYDGGSVRQLEMVPAEPVRLGDWKFASVRA